MKTIAKKLITKYLRKNLKHYTDDKYLFHRWLVSLVVDRYLERDLIERLACSEECLGCAGHLSDVFLFDGKLHIVTSRPGLWIGKKGELIDKLQYKLGPIELIENRNDNQMLFFDTRHVYMSQF